MTLRSVLLEAIFPTRCVACEADGAWFCDACRSRVERFFSFAPRDETPSDVDALVAVGFYHDPRLRALIQALKYHGATCLAPVITDLVRDWTRDRSGPWPWADEASLGLQAVVAAPRRVRERGFDQAEILCDIVKQEVARWAEPLDALQRGASVSTQADLEVGELRRANVAGAFSLKTGIKDLPCAVILVDDVVTTGATMSAAASVLRAAGVERVYGWALAMGK